MLIEDFVSEILKQIRLGIELANEDTTCKAEMPESIDFDLGIISIDEEIHVCSDLDKNQNISHMKFAIHTKNYPWLKDSKIKKI